ncbi:MAG: NifB/NifX family molybdenum-iron cluster-binding protein [Candidatus Aureabacteria bacterium]|nr:NifB/NifX family molybdenum-iron cluster-binding protein [Candidatus Auribacterota bacterium]
MRIAVPIKEDRGLESPVHGHFGSAPIFARVDSETMEFKAFQNRNLEHAHGMCNPLSLIKDMQVDALICAGMGTRALQLLNQADIKVFKTSAQTVREAITHLTDGSLPEMTEEGACSEHGCH